MKIDPHAPVIVGAGQVLHHDSGAEEPCEPAEMIVQALRRAGRDSATGERLLHAAESIRCVPVIGWPYPDVGALVAAELGARPRETRQSAAIGGDGPQALLNATAAEIAAGRLDVALIGGGEAGASLRAAQLQGRALRWRRQDEGTQPAPAPPADRAPVGDVELAAGLAPPVYMYALIESAVRAASGLGPAAHLEAIGALWSRFSRVAAHNPYAWIQQPRAAAEIAAPGPGNRMISTPYTKLLTANIQVNMASGLILVSARAAERAGVPRERWVFVHAGAHAQDEWHVGGRDTLCASRAIHAAGRAVAHRAGVAIDEIAHIDLYSCFPSAVQIAARELGLALDDPSRPLTVTGGLTFAGGPGNNYAGHSIATLVRRLREDPGAWGLATALGWYVTKHAVGLYSTRPPRQRFADLDPRPPRPRARPTTGEHDGPATVEAFTIPHDRDGDPEAAILSAITPEGARVLIRSEDPGLVGELLARDPIGHRVAIAGRRLRLEPAPAAVAEAG